MRFPVVFKRRKGGAGPIAVLGSDTAPTSAAPSASADNVLSCKIRDINGWPVQRIAVCWTTDAGAPVALNGDLYFWEESSGHWYKINDAALSLKPNQLFFFDTVSISEPPPNAATLGAAGSSAQAGAMNVMLIVTDPGAAANGTYTIAMGPDLTTVGT